MIQSFDENIVFFRQKRTILASIFVFVLIVNLSEFYLSNRAILFCAINRSGSSKRTSGGNPTIQSLPPFNYSSTAASAFPECYDETTTLLPSRQQALLSEINQMPWLDMDFGHNTTVCGNNKCYYPSRTNSSVGYLVAGNVSKTFHTMTMATVLERDLYETFGAHVLSLPDELPQLVDLSHEMECLLADRARQPARPPDMQQLVFYPNLTDDPYYRPTDRPRHVVVHRVNPAPEPYLLLALTLVKLNTFMTSFPSFVQNHVSNKTAFRINFLRQLEDLRPLVEARPELYPDFQGLVDYNGNFYHMDVDRAFQNWTTGARAGAAKNFYPRLQSVVDFVRSTLR
mmetsp:Transcript_7031/g.14401  ORF Transcript_7031/g.14401 Transcript_7031/m.14401 type:complete len:342 (-) Transcript_7031:287-1312(-)